MTCIEKWRQDHPNEDESFVLKNLCPNDDCGIPIPDPDSCSGGGACIKCWNREIPGTESSAVDHPKHYGREGAMECIDEMVLVFGVEATMNFCLLNSWKYRYRAADKNGAEDIEKSDWYMAKYAELKGGDANVPQ